ncbi:MAG: radical SAM protein [Candidatus Omnitrophota bacterium]
MKILLLNAPPLRKYGVVGQIYPPLGILYLAAYLRQGTSRFEIKVVDGYQEKNIEQTVKKILSFSPDIIGLSFTTQAATGAYEVIREVKKRLPGVFVVTGGPHPTIYPEESIFQAGADTVVVGEGEETFSELVNRLATNLDYGDIKGIAFRQDGRLQVNEPRPLIQDLDNIPFPARDLLDIRTYPGYHYKKSAWDTSYLSGRGCPYNCTYCSNPVWKMQKPYLRLRSPENIASEVESLKATYRVREFYDQTDLFNGNLNWAKQVCDEFIRRRLDIFWKVQMTVRNIDDELARKMVESGCWLGLLGIETGNDATSRGINKRTTRQDAERALCTLKRNGLKTFGLFMAFNVWEEDGRLKYEDRQATLATLDFAREMVRKGCLDIISWSLTTPYPGSALFEIARRHKLIDPEAEGKWERWDSSENFLMKLPGVSQEDWELVKRKGKMLQAKLLLRSGTFSFRSLPVYGRKAWNLVKRLLK